MIGFPKPSRTARKKAKLKTVTELKTKEVAAKRASKARDLFRCRFPLCGCKKLGINLGARRESSHDRHKGIGGNPAGDRSTRDGLITLCSHRHQDGIISRHKGTLRTAYLTKQKNDGPVAWEVDVNRLRPDFSARPQKWVEVARETAVQVLAPMSEQQRRFLEKLAEMDV